MLLAAPDAWETGRRAAGRWRWWLALAAWDFSRDIASQRVTDSGPYLLHGRLINLPTRAVVGARWTGAEHCWRHAPAEYAAIHFHAGHHTTHTRQECRCYTTLKSNLNP